MSAPATPIASGRSSQLGCVVIIWGAVALMSWAFLGDERVRRDFAEQQPGARGALYFVFAFYGIPAVIATIVLLKRSATSKKALCPHCRRATIRFQEGELARCPACDDFSMIANNELVPLREDYCAAAPFFACQQPAGNPASWVWPWLLGTCCVCGRRARRQERHAASYVSHARDINFSTREITFQDKVLVIPHCRECATGMIVTDSGVILFRSYKNWKLFMQLNRVSGR